MASDASKQRMERRARERTLKADSEHVGEAVVAELTAIIHRLLDERCALQEQNRELTQALVRLAVRNQSAPLSATSPEAVRELSAPVSADCPPAVRTEGGLGGGLSRSLNVNTQDHERLTSLTSEISADKTAVRMLSAADTKADKPADSSADTTDVRKTSEDVRAILKLTEPKRETQTPVSDERHRASAREQQERLRAAVKEGKL